MSKNKKGDSFFSKNLLLWHIEKNQRVFPWKEGRDPYKTWLSEVLLQQTRAEHGLPYYLKFVEAYPTIQDLAHAKDDDVFLLWQGLGYYNRCKNLLITAREITEKYNGIFPDTYDEILKLKGIGHYTASAISSFVYDLPNAVLDGNVYRVLSRYFGVFLPIDSAEGKKAFQLLAQNNLPENDSAAYNQAIMDFGAFVCKPRKPLCSICYLSSKCVAYKDNLMEILPVKEKKIKIKTRHFHYFLLMYQDEVYISKRTQKDIWQNLYELYLIEVEEGVDFENKKEWIALKPFIGKKELNVFEYKQRLTHQIILSSFHILHLKNRHVLSDSGLWVKATDLKKYSFPKTILSFPGLKNYF